MNGLGHGSPEFDGFILTATQEARSIGRKGDRVDGPFVLCQGTKSVARSRFPEFNLSGKGSFEGEAIVATPIAPHQSSQVQFQGSWWLARSVENGLIPKGAIVRVIGRINLTLLVEPLCLA